ncbi:MAG: NADase-type glycan-binding domain-containing protein [Bacteroidia bacterium]
MQKLLAFIFLLSCSLLPAQTGYEIILYTAEVNEFDVFGEDAYEKNNRLKEDITDVLKPSVSSTVKAEPAGTDNFDPKNLLDANMKTCWMTPAGGKNEAFEIIIDLEDVENISGAQIKFIYFFNGWRKDYHTWKDYSRIKKMSMTVNDAPFAEISFEDTYKCQSIDLDKLKIGKDRRCRIRFRIMETYAGSTHNQAALSDVQLLGKAK